MYCWLLLQIYLCYLWLLLWPRVTHTHTHTHIYIYIYIFFNANLGLLIVIVGHVWWLCSSNCSFFFLWRKTIVNICKGKTFASEHKVSSRKVILLWRNTKFFGGTQYFSYGTQSFSGECKHFTSECKVSWQKFLWANAQFLGGMQNFWEWTQGFSGEQMFCE